MKKAFKILFLAGISAGMFMLVSPDIASARGGAGAGRNTQTAWRQYCVNSQYQYVNCQRFRLRDGSCVWANQAPPCVVQQRGYTYGPGDGTGNAGSGPKNGTGYGAPSTR